MALVLVEMSRTSVSKNLRWARGLAAATLTLLVGEELPALLEAVPLVLLLLLS